MYYWISLIFLFTVFIAILLYNILFKLIQKKKNGNTKRDIFSNFIIPLCVILIFLIPLSIDIPSALSGGQEIYVNELPTYIGWSTYFSYVKTDNKLLKHMQGCNWDRYEKYGNYRIRYTKFTKFVLEIEKLD